MEDWEAMVREIYTAFNGRDVEGCFRQMAEGVDWPTASEGGRVVGKEAVRAYWARQWAEFDPRVDPLKVIEREDGRLDVRVHQVVRSLRGEVLLDGEVWHSYALANGLIQRMDVHESEPAAEGDSTQTASAGWKLH